MDESKIDIAEKNIMKDLGKKAFMKFTKKKVDKNVFERTGDWVNKASKCNFR